MNRWNISRKLILAFALGPLALISVAESRQDQLVDGGYGAVPGDAVRLEQTTESEWIEFGWNDDCAAGLEC